MEDYGCAWMALNEPPTSPSTVAAVAVSVVVGGYRPSLSIPLSVVLE